MVQLLYFYIFFKEIKSDDTADAKSPSNLPIYAEKKEGMFIILEGNLQNLQLYYINSSIDRNRRNRENTWNLEQVDSINSPNILSLWL